MHRSMYTTTPLRTPELACVCVLHSFLWSGLGIGFSVACMLDVLYRSPHP